MNNPIYKTRRSGDWPPIAIYSTTPWNGIWRPRHEYALLLARCGWRVIYTTGPLSTWDRGGEEWRCAPLFGGIEQVNDVTVDRVGRLPFRWPGRALDSHVLRWHARKIRSAVGAKDIHDLIAIVFDPVFLPHVAQLKPRHTVYFQYEALAQLPGSRRNFHEFEDKLVSQSNLIVSLTTQMAEVLPGTGASRAKILPSAVRIGSFLNAGMQPCPEDLMCIPHPRIGYVGSITIALDFDLILDVAIARPSWHFVFIGPVERDGGTGSLRDPVFDAKWQSLRDLPNVHYFPQKPIATVPAYMAHMHVNALWYRTTGNGWWLLGSPIKLYENLAVGKPVVGTSLAAIRKFKGFVELADTVDEWVAALSRAINENVSSKSKQRTSVAQENSWEKRTETLESWLLEMIDNG